MEYFHVQHTVFGINDKRKYIKNPCAGKKRKAWNKPTKPFPNKWKSKLAKSDKGLITTKGNGLINMNMEKGGITVNMRMMTLI